MPDDNNEENTEFDPKAFAALLQELPDNVGAAIQKGISNTIREENDRLAEARAQANAKKDDDDDFEEEEDSSVDLDELSNKELVGVLEKRFGRSLEKALKPLIKDMSSHRQQTDAEKIKQEFQQTAEKYPDFAQWKDEMKAVSKQNPGLSVEDMYLLAKSRNPDKAEKIQEKLEELKKEKDQEDKPKRSFGGLTPTSGISTQNGQDMDPKEAAAAAWDEAMSGLDPELFSPG